MRDSWWPFVFAFTASCCAIVLLLVCSGSENTVSLESSAMTTAQIKQLELEMRRVEKTHHFSTISSNSRLSAAAVKSNIQSAVAQKKSSAGANKNRNIADAETDITDSPKKLMKEMEAAMKMEKQQQEMGRGHNKQQQQQQQHQHAAAVAHKHTVAKAKMNKGPNQAISDKQLSKILQMAMSVEHGQQPKKKILQKAKSIAHKQMAAKKQKKIASAKAVENKKQEENLEASLSEAADIISKIMPPPTLHRAEVAPIEKFDDDSPVASSSHRKSVKSKIKASFKRTMPKIHLPTSINDIKEPPVLENMKRDKHGHLILPSFRKLRFKLPSLPSFVVPSRKSKWSNEISHLRDEIDSVHPKQSQKQIIDAVAAKIKHSILNHLKEDVDREVSHDVNTNE